VAAGLGIAVVASWSLRQYRRGTGFIAVEKFLLIAVVGSVGIFLLVSLLPGPQGGFQGFDDAQDLAGGSLLSRGFFPWRDMLFIHGLFPDVLEGTIGTALFGDTRWAVAASNGVILYPLS